MRKIKKLYAIVFMFVLVSVSVMGCADKKETADTEKTTSKQESASNKSEADGLEEGSESYGATTDDASAGTDSGESTEETGANTSDDDTEQNKETADKTQTTVKKEENKATGGTDGIKQTTTKKDNTQAENVTTKKNTQQATSKIEQSTKPAATKPNQTTQPVATQPATTASANQGQNTPSQSVTLPITVSDKALNMAASITAKITASTMSEFEKVKAIHDYIVINVNYPSVIDMSNPSLFSAEGALINNLAVCQGYAEAFSVLCYKAGIQTEIVYGTANNGLGNGPESHAWNLVRIDNIWYQIDTTWDDPLGSDTANGKNMQYTYFLIPDSVMGKNHFADSYTNKYACTDTKYVEYGEQMTAMLAAKQLFGDMQCSFAASEADVQKIVTANSSSGIKTYIIAYNMGEALNSGKDAVMETKVNEMYGWISGLQSQSNISSYGYLDGNKYLLIKIG